MRVKESKMLNPLHLQDMYLFQKCVLTHMFYEKSENMLAIGL